MATEVWNAEGLKAVTNGNYIQMADIDMQGESWTSISDFYGTYDGNGFTISNLSGTFVHMIDLYAGKAAQATLKNITLSGGSGGLVGTIYCYDSGIQISIENCDVLNRSASGGLLVNLLYVGDSASVSISDCTVSGSASGAYVGALIGDIHNWMLSSIVIERCLANATVSVAWTGSGGEWGGYGGGFVGQIATFSGAVTEIKQCLLEGDINGNDKHPIGGFAGYVSTYRYTGDPETGHTLFRQCALVGNINNVYGFGGGYVGYILAQYLDVIFEDCYFQGYIGQNPEETEYEWHKALGGAVGLLEAFYSVTVSFTRCYVSAEIYHNPTEPNSPFLDSVTAFIGKVDVDHGGNATSIYCYYNGSLTIYWGGDYATALNDEMMKKWESFETHYDITTVQTVEHRNTDYLWNIVQDESYAFHSWTPGTEEPEEPSVEIDQAYPPKLGGTTYIRSANHRVEMRFYQGSDVGKVHFKVSMHDYNSRDLIKEIDSFTSPELFEVSMLSSNYSEFPPEGIGAGYYTTRPFMGCYLRALFPIGPIDGRLFLKASAIRAVDL